MPKSVEDLIKSGSDDEKISRIRYLENESQSMLAYGLDANDTPAAWEGLYMMLDTALLANSLKDANRRHHYNPTNIALNAVNAFHQVAMMDPKLVTAHQETAFPFLIALGTLVPRYFAYEAAWHIAAEQDLIRDPHQRAAIGGRHLRFYAEGLEPFLYREMHDARLRGDEKTAQNLEDLWHSNLMFMFTVHRSTATGIVRDRIREEERKVTKDAQSLSRLNRMKGMFTVIDDKERERRLRLAAEHGDGGGDATKAVFGAARVEFASLERPSNGVQLIAGTQEAESLRHPERAIRFLKKFTPPEGSDPH